MILRKNIQDNNFSFAICNEKKLLSTVQLYKITMLNTKHNNRTHSYDGPNIGLQVNEYYDFYSIHYPDDFYYDNKQISKKQLLINKNQFRIAFIFVQKQFYTKQAK